MADPGSHQGVNQSALVGGLLARSIAYPPKL
ncbi:MAG: hypothetical protein RLZZ490_727 [Cyanobacteriota bacterium]|jgi:hypothetical protein